MPTWEHQTHVLTSMVGRDKIRMDDLTGVLNQRGLEGWELVTLVPDADIKGSRDGHLLIFKRPVPGN